ncbi:MAG: two-component sensor histidine kinase [Myxococcales bacterium]|nr:two-component sensor histidine kinase [Myxococcales bacterium]
MSPRPRGTLAVRIYAFSAGIAIAVMAALLLLPRFIGSPRYLEPQAALVQNMVDRFSTRDPHKVAESMARLQQRLKGALTLYDPSFHVVRSTVDPPLSVPSPGELSDLESDKWSIGWGRIVVRADDGSMLGVYEPTRPGFPWHFVLPIGAGVLIVVGAASLWFSRRLVRPLGELASAARRFGGGDTGARVDLHRDDELGDVGKAFDDMAGRTATLISSQRQLMADVSHELRTPLARIRVALELAAEDPVAAKDVLADVGTDLDEIDQLIEDILTTARLDSDHAEIATRPLAVGELAKRAADRFKARHPGRVLERGPADDREIECDPVLLRRALDNLLDNAAKYSDVDEPVKLEVHPNGTLISFEVVDHGIGMTPEELERAFTPFWRADSSRARRTGGVGLGLALARRIARAHGGDVTLASSPGRGTTARLEIPLSKLGLEGSS